MAASPNYLPAPPALRIARTGSFAALVSLAVVQYLVPCLWSGREIARSVYPEYVERSCFVIVIVGLFVNVGCVRYRNGGMWLMYWVIAALLAVLLQPAIATS